MRRLLPVAGPAGSGDAVPGQVDRTGGVDLWREYAHPAGVDRWVRANMIASVDGASALDGRSGGLGVPADRALFRLLRTLADVVLVGAGTARAERYGPVRLDPRESARRRAAGRPGAPPLAVVTARCELDLDGPLFADPGARPLLLTTAAAPADRRARAAEVADVVVAGVERVEPARLLDVLAERGHRRVLTEGGPHLLADLVAADRLDELCLTVAPRVVGGPARRVLDGPLADAGPWTLAGLLEEEGALFARYRRR